MIVSDGADHQRRRGLFQRAQAFIEAPGIKQLPHPFPYTARSRVRADRRGIDRIIDEEVADRRAQPIGGPLDIGAPAMALSWRNGAVVNTDTIADGVAGRHAIPEVLEDLLEVVDDVVLVDDESINAGMRHLFDFAGLVEPSAALGGARRGSRSRRSRAIPRSQCRDDHLRQQHHDVRLSTMGSRP